MWELMSIEKIPERIIEILRIIVREHLWEQSWTSKNILVISLNNESWLTNVKSNKLYRSLKRNWTKIYEEWHQKSCIDFNVQDNQQIRNQKMYLVNRKF